ncbi:MAG: ribonuclease P protein component [Xenococcaceae cyanobacterium]
MGLQKANRLRNRRDFQTVYQQGIRRSSSHLILRALSSVKSEEATQEIVSRFGISISLKVSKKAVVRNRIKRWIKAAIRELMPQLDRGWKVVIVVRSNAVECKYEHFLRELKQLLTNAKIINGH